MEAGLGIVWLPTQMADVQGHITIVNSQVSDTAQFSVAVPTQACAGVSRPSSTPATVGWTPDSRNASQMNAPSAT